MTPRQASTTPQLIQVKCRRRIVHLLPFLDAEAMCGPLHSCWRCIATFDGLADARAAVGRGQVSVLNCGCFVRECIILDDLAEPSGDVVPAKMEIPCGIINAVGDLLEYIEVLSPQIQV